MLRELLICSAFLQVILSDCSASTCEACANCTAGCGWCLQESKCSLEKDCKSDFFLVNDAWNCPKQPSPNYPYNETIARDWVLPMTAAAYSDNPTSCLSKRTPSVTFYKQVTVPCDEFKKLGDNCSAYTAYDSSLQQIIITFRGSAGKYEMLMEFFNVLKQKDNFFGVGKVFDYFYTAFIKLWQAQIGEDFHALRRLSPGYKIMVFGHSLGASLAVLCATYLVRVEGIKGSDIHLITFGEPRTGDRNFADFVESNLLNSYRIVHELDPIPRLPPQIDIFDLSHHRFELWYKNDMTPGSTYDVCPYSDLMGACANSKQLWQFPDHTSYFHPPQPIPAWGKNGCPDS